MAGDEPGIIVVCGEVDERGAQPSVKIMHKQSPAMHYTFRFRHPEIQISCGFLKRQTRQLSKPSGCTNIPTAGSPSSTVRAVSPAMINKDE
jgi:hypothetical protein